MSLYPVGKLAHLLHFSENEIMLLEENKQTFTESKASGPTFWIDIEEVYGTPILSEFGNL